MRWVKPWFEILWAPWRMKYIASTVKSRSVECIFCEAPKLGSDEEALILYRSSKNYVILNKYPYNTGHTMVTTFRHIASIEDLGDDELLEASKLVKAVVRALRRLYNPHGFNVGINIGSAAGAGIAGHFHIHIVPRWSGDANFMLTTGGTKVLPETLDITYRRLKPVLEEEARREGV